MTNPRDPDDQRDPRPTYTVYRARGRSLLARLRGETDPELGARAAERSRRQPPRDPPPGERPSRRRRRESGPGQAAGPTRPRGLRRIPGLRPSRRPRLHPIRLLRYLVSFCVLWVVLSAVLFLVSASGDPGSLPGGRATRAALTSAGPMLVTPNNILVVGLDVRPRTGYSSREPGSNYNERYANTDTLMIWRVGGGVSRKLSVPRDTLVNIPGCGMQKINAAWSCGGPQETIRIVEHLTGVRINHMIVIDFGNFVKFISDIGGVTVRTPHMCATISGGTANGGYTLNLSAGVHHLTADQAMTLARVRHMPCDPAYTDFNREEMQQVIMNAVKRQMFSLHAFIHLPWAAWDAPKALQTDMGPLDLMQLFAAAEMGGSSKPQILGGSFGTYNGADVVITNRAVDAAKVRQLLTGR
ncbi:LCP family protein [Conexibacter sp. S30A1]|uniref:LCP family protein n=1 Tax=Conexibacter sp. S30A1 TaxID=2937800 RepID=UPI00200CE091|nr:LCP family protein [Conexibacter sp. S30A1]